MCGTSLKILSSVALIFEELVSPKDFSNPQKTGTPKEGILPALDSLTQDV
jgi:hypothetical protein